jgi:hypothetical protein
MGDDATFQENWSVVGHTKKLKDVVGMNAFKESIVALSVRVLTKT